MVGHAWGHLGLDFSLPHVGVVPADVEEVLTVHLAGWVVFVHWLLDWLVQWLLDVPEGVRGHGVQDLLRQWRLQSLSEGILQILNVVVFLAILENGELLVEHVIPLVDWQVGDVQLLHESNSQLVVILIESTINSLLVGVGIVDLPETLLTEFRGEFLILDSVVEGAFVILDSIGQWIEESLGQGTLLILALWLGDDWLWSLGLVGVQRLLILVESLSLFVGVSQELISLLLVVSDENILPLGLNVVLGDLLDVVLDLLLVGLVLSLVALLHFVGLADLDQLETETLGPLLEELVHALLGVESWSSKLQAPPWLMSLVGHGPWVTCVHVHDDILVENGLSEGPDSVLVKTMVNEWLVGVWWVGPYGFTLHIGVMINTIIIIDWHDSRVTNSLVLVVLEWLHALESVILVHGVFLEVIVVGSVLVDVGVPAVELVVNVVGEEGALEDLVSAHGDTVAD